MVEESIVNTVLAVRSRRGAPTSPATMPYEIIRFPVIYKISVSAQRYGTGFSFILVYWCWQAAIVDCLLAAILDFIIGQKPVEVASNFWLASLHRSRGATRLGIIRYDLMGIAPDHGGLGYFPSLVSTTSYWSLPFFVFAVAGLYTLLGPQPRVAYTFGYTARRRKSILFARAWPPCL